MNRLQKIAVAITTAVGGLGIAGMAGATGNYITLPGTFIDDLLAYVGGMFSDLSVVVILVIGLPLAFWVIRRVIGLVRAR